ncbi:chromosomal replication initiator protein DnaA [Thiomicrospira aerophila AL3]|uniref:Chromosomal replication initiator protein DnaA n=1 Tax=Thiomicrospira aerophila AL3 TaxID=717772 RepID=W0DWV3_9GAMM|nr:DnaA regulatory inactivator Hda [Thiomicrospira aerophila]AHF01469.1 chromosomal replication initiator protein DnaA [Thiomicrospira aerophila AL3]
MLIQLPLKINLPDTACFESYVAPDASVALTLSQLQAADSGGLSKGVYFYGGDGVGKTHLLQAACRAVSIKGGRSVYFPLKEKQLPLIPDVLKGLEVMDLICLDDVDQVIDQGAWQAALQDLLFKSAALGHPLLLSGTLPMALWPMSVPELRDAMFSLLPVKLTPLQESDDLVLALQRHAMIKGFELPKDVANFLIKRFSTNLEELLAVLQMLEQATLAEQRRLTLPFTKLVLAR